MYSGFIIINILTIYGDNLVPVKCISAPSPYPFNPGGLGYCLFKGGGSLLVYILLNISLIGFGFCVWSLFCNALLCVPSSIAINLTRKRELVALL